MLFAKHIMLLVTFFGAMGFLVCLSMRSIWETDECQLTLFGADPAAGKIFHLIGYLWFAERDWKQYIYIYMHPHNLKLWNAEHKAEAGEQPRAWA